MFKNKDNKGNKSELKVTNKDKFLWGASTSAFQTEGTNNSDGRGPCIWDTFEIKNTYRHMNANIACNSYVQYEDDIKEKRKKKRLKDKAIK